MKKTPSTWISGVLMALVLLLAAATQIHAYPVAVLGADPLAGLAPLAVEFDGSDSWDTRGAPIVRYVWNFNDGSPVVQSTDGGHTKHVFNAPGDYHVHLTVYNALGHSKTARQLVRVSSVPSSLRVSHLFPLLSAGRTVHISSVGLGDLGDSGPPEGIFLAWMT